MKEVINFKVLVLVLVLTFSFSFVFSWVDGGAEGGTSTDVSTQNNLICTTGVNSASWLFGEQVINVMTSTVGTCFNESIVGGGSGYLGTSNIATDVCCPSGYSCDKITGECEINLLGIERCEDYLTEISCEGAISEDIADSVYAYFILSLETNGIFITETIDDLGFCEGSGPFYKLEFVDDVGVNKCARIGGCACYWNSSDSCVTHFDALDCDTSILNPDSYNCDTPSTPLDTDCSDGTYLLSWNAISYKNGVATTPNFPWCQPGQKEFPCPSVSVIPFFGLFNFALTGFLIVGVYFFVRKK